jgi:hypothetical protein
MLLRCKCPSCGEVKEYVQEQVGSELDCFRCGARFPLKGNPVRVTGHIIVATLAVLITIGGIASRAYWRAHRWERMHDRHAKVATFQPHAAPSDPDDD